MEKKENQRIELTKRLLKEALLKLMSQKSIQKISVSELCRTAGINRSTFYNHYGSQFEVLREMEMDMISDLENMWDGVYAAKISAFNKRIEMLCAYIKDNRDFTSIAFSNSDINSEFVTLLFGSVRLQSINEILISKEDDNYKRELMKTYFLYGTYHMIRRWALDDFPISPAEMSETVCDMLQCGREMPEIKAFP